VLARPEWVIFDCDGVPVDSGRVAISVDVEVLREAGQRSGGYRALRSHSVIGPLTRHQNHTKVALS
jgi:beta-phosphoglucomutase-like phosphatase (HAD superfamily)